MALSFSVCMMLEAVNRMGPSLNNAMRQVNQLKDQLERIPKNITSTVKIKRIEETVRKMRESASRANSKAMRDGANGAAIMTPVVKTVKDFAQVEDNFTSLKIAAYDSSVPAIKMQEELKKATTEAQRLGDMTRFSTREAYEGMTTLVKGGANLKDVYSGLGEAALYLAQAGGVDVTQSAEAMVKISNAYQLSGEQMKSVADMINRVDGASTASVLSLQIGFKYAAGAAGQLGQSVKETAQALAVLNNRGLDGSTAGTNYADMLNRLIPQTRQQTDYMMSLGWVRDDGSSIFFNQDTGKLKDMMEVIGIMRSTFAGLKNLDKKILFDDTGQQLRSLDEAKEMMGSTDRDMKAYDQLKYLHKIFGEQGGRAAMAIMQNGKGSWEEVGDNISKAMPLNQRIGVQSKTLMGRFENMMGSVQNLSADSGSPIGTFLSERLDGITEMINKTRAWAQANPEVVKGIMWIVTSLGMLKIGSMVFNLMKSGVLSLAGNLLSLFGGLGKVKIGLGNLKAGYDLLRGTGAGRFMSLIQGAQLAFPWLGKLTGGFGRFAAAYKSARLTGLGFGKSITQGLSTVFPLLGRAKNAAGGVATKLKSFAKMGIGLGKVMGRDALIGIKAMGSLGKSVAAFSKKWLLHAGRIAAGWLIAMGPPGWIIMGVTALVIAGVAAWKTNFMGFRDKCISCWNAISAWGSKTWDNICGFVATAMDKVGGFIEQVKRALGLAGELDKKPHTWGPIKGLQLDTPTIPYLNPDAGDSNTNHINSNYTFNTYSADDTVSIAGRMGANEYLGADGNPPANGNYF